MKFGRVKYNGEVRCVLIDEKGASLIKGDIFGDWLKTGEKIDARDLQLVAPVEPRQIVAIGRNYRGHAEEQNAQVPEEPLIFLKGVNALIGPGEAISLPQVAPEEVDYEAELVVVIGKTAKNVSEDRADDYIFGYTCGNDVTARDCQQRRDKQWARAKSFDTFAPIGPWIATDIEPDNLEITLTLNGNVMQKANTSMMIHSCRKLVSFISHCMTLYPGSLIMTGTPEGVGCARNPKVFLKEGDVVMVEIEGIGKLINGVINKK